MGSIIDHKAMHTTTKIMTETTAIKKRNRLASIKVLSYFTRRMFVNYSTEQRPTETRPSGRVFWRIGAPRFFWGQAQTPARGDAFRGLSGLKAVW
jgi:hypothetical protein